MGRRRTIGEARSAGAGRPCRHPRSAVEYQLTGKGRPARLRCTRCGQELLASDDDLRAITAFDAMATTALPKVPWFTPQKVTVQTAELTEWHWRCRLCFARVGVVEFPTRGGCLHHLTAVHSRVPPPAA